MFVATIAVSIRVTRGSMSISAIGEGLVGLGGEVRPIRWRSASMSSLLRRLSNSAVSEGSIEMLTPIEARSRSATNQVLKRQLPGLVEENVDDYALR